MTLPVSVRLDEEATQALRTLEATGVSRSDAIRNSLLLSASHLRRKQIVADEFAALQADTDDRTEIQAIAEMMEASRAPW